MDTEARERWCAALETKGKNTVRAELEMRPGHPSDLVFDVGTEPPYPTRAFCEQWCSGETAKSSGRGGYIFVVVALAVIIFICVGRSISGYRPPANPGLPQPMAAASAGGGGTGSASAGSSAALKNGSVVNTSESQRLSAACSAVNYAADTATVHALPACSKLGTPTSARPGASNSGH
jgi:hypothetical protein